jgi:hypothetical protein
LIEAVNGNIQKHVPDKNVTLGVLSSDIGSAVIRTAVYEIKFTLIFHCPDEDCSVTVYLESESRATVKTELLRLNGAVVRDRAIDAWMKQHQGELGAIARHWFEVMRKCGDEVREVLHDGCPVACLGDAPFAYVNVFTAHVNVGFFQGANLPDPARLLEGSGKFMRHVKLRPGTSTNTAALSELIETAYWDIKSRVENG